MAEEVKPGEEIVRVLRIVEYVGPRTAVETQVRDAISGTRRFSSVKSTWGPQDVQITACTLGTFPEVLHKAEADAWMLVREIEEPPPLHPSKMATTTLNANPQTSRVPSVAQQILREAQLKGISGK